jgi:alginate O-acetyltransferase complex protein AlgI
MLFNTIPCFVFFFVVAALFYTAPSGLRKPVLLFASYFFYASWNWKFLPLLLTLTAIDYFAALWIEDRKGPVRKMAFAVSVAANLGFLGFFKYFNFLLSNLAVLLHLPANSFWFDIVLPLGISFHTFQSISYVTDVYHGQQRAVRNPLDYALFIAFFPQLVAGPIVRAQNFFADLYQWEAPGLMRNGRSVSIKRGSFLVVLGLFKKVALADNLAPVADKFFESPLHVTGAAAWSGVLAFALQIYFDFSGYTDIAIGFAELLGFHFPVNFRRPYFATSITDFWRRWHISLSSWLRDYLYIPLGGNRGGRLKTYRNLIITMLLGGLWHGANWTFMAWGLFHGVLLSIERVLGINKASTVPKLTTIPRIVLTFATVSLGWILFRARSFHQAMLVFNSVMRYPRGHWDIEPLLLVLIGCAAVLAIIAERTDLLSYVDRIPVWVLSPTLGTLLFVVELLAPTVPLRFIYYQF